MRGRVGSLNAAVAGSVLLFEVLAQRDAVAGTVASRAQALPGGPDAPATAPEDEFARSAAADEPDAARGEQALDATEPEAAVAREENPPTAREANPPTTEAAGEPAKRRRRAVGTSAADEEALLPGGPVATPTGAADRPRSRRAAAAPTFGQEDRPMEAAPGGGGREDVAGLGRPSVDVEPAEPADPDREP